MLARITPPKTDKKDEVSAAVCTAHNPLRSDLFVLNHFYVNTDPVDTYTMPSFAKPSVASTAAPFLVGAMKDSPDKLVLDDLLASSRSRALRIIREDIPGKIVHIQHLLLGESDPSSPLWIGHLTQGDYAHAHPRMFYSGDRDSMERAGMIDGKLDGEKVVLPADITRLSKVMGAATLSELPSKKDEEESSVTESESSRTSDSGDSDEDMLYEDGKKVKEGGHWFEVVPKNKTHNDLIRLTLNVDLIVWLELEIPLIEDGNSFGADVQADLIRELDDNLKRATMFHNGMRMHWNDRTKLAMDWVKYPNLMDIPTSIAASDRFDHFLVRSHLRRLLVAYGGLLTKFERNWLKVVNPKGNSASSGGMY